MFEGKLKERSAGLSSVSRKVDRRYCTQLAPPPYSTREGVILDDRRCYLDRRAAWLKEFFMKIGDNNHG